MFISLGSTKLFNDYLTLYAALIYAQKIVKSVSYPANVLSSNLQVISLVRGSSGLRFVNTIIFDLENNC